MQHDLPKAGKAIYQQKMDRVVRIPTPGQAQGVLSRPGPRE